MEEEQENRSVIMKKKVVTENFLERVPIPNGLLKWRADEDGSVELLVENTGLFNRIAQKLFGKPEVTHVHLDGVGSFVWPLLDGERNIIEIGELVKEHFGEKAEPLYERLSEFFRILDSYHFIEWK